MKLLPVTRALEAAGSRGSILSSLPDALEALPDSLMWDVEKCLRKKASKEKLCEKEKERERESACSNQS